MTSEGLTLTTLDEVGTRRRVAIIVTGGTIVSVGTDRTDLASYADAGTSLDLDELLTGTPEVRSIAEIEEVAFRRVSSQGLVVADWLDLVRVIHRICESSRVDGVVIAHGTGTLEETAYFLQLTLKTDRPVAFVGAMRPASAVSADGPLNLINAVRVAAAPESVGRGVLVVLNDTIYSARDVTKTTTYRVEAFQGRDCGPLGYANADGSIAFYHRVERRHTVSTEFDVRQTTSLPRVDVVVSYVGADGAMIDAVVAAGAAGIVSAGVGSGRPTPAEEEALDRAHGRGVVVCQTTRTGSGRVVRTPSLVGRGFVVGDNLTPWKARALLSLALYYTRNPLDIQRMFDMY